MIVKEITVKVHVRHRWWFELGVGCIKAYARITRRSVSDKFLIAFARRAIFVAVTPCP